MTTLVETLNKTREETITYNYDAAKTELNDKIKRSPLKTVFHIRAGCISDDIADEIANRFNKEGINTILVQAGYISSRYLEVTVDLPTHLSHNKTQ